MCAFKEHMHVPTLWVFFLNFKIRFIGLIERHNGPDVVFFSLVVKSYSRFSSCANLKT